MLQKSITFTGGAGAGAVGSVTALTTTGSVLLRSLTFRCTTDLASVSGTISCGIAGSVIGFIGVTTATTIDTGELWLTNTPTAGLLALPAALQNIVLNANVLLNVLLTDITGGVLEVVAEYMPLSADGALA